MTHYLKLKVAIIFFSMILCGCRHDEPASQVYPIQQELETQSLQLDWGNMTAEEKQQYKQLSFVINSENEFPQENLLNLDKIKSIDIDFDKYTLLLSYNIVGGIVESHRYVWQKNLQEDQFELSMHFKVKATDSGNSDLNEGEEAEIESSKKENYVTYYCTALLVNKIPADSKVEFWISYTSLP